MGQFVTPKVYHVGYTAMDKVEMDRYLRESGNLEFGDAIAAARQQGLSDAEILCSFYAKLCYASLTVGKNDNISKVREIRENLIATFDAAHLSVFEHANLNFVVRDCSRVFTHEAVRHRAGTAHSQTSGRYVRTDQLNVVFDPILDPIKQHCEGLVSYLETWYSMAVEGMQLAQEKDFARKKKITSALRRFLPNGQSNEIGVTHNIRALRHIVMMRTARHAEWEIRCVYEQIYKLTKQRYPLLYYGAKETMVEGVLEISGMRMQPYEAVQ